MSNYSEIYQKIVLYDTTDETLFFIYKNFISKHIGWNFDRNRQYILYFNPYIQLKIDFFGKI